MVICHCKAINDAAIRDLIARAGTTADDVAELCGAGTDCGACRPTIEDLLESAGRETAVAL
jgi:bacterioferritin-associated ferredoxin